MPPRLLTLLWAQDFQFVNYTFRELASENAVPIERAIRSHRRRRRRAPRGGGKAPPKREDWCDRRLRHHALLPEDTEVEYLKKDVEREYAQDLRRNVLAMLFDLLELQTYGTVRAELISIVENFIPYLLEPPTFARLP